MVLAQTSQDSLLTPTSENPEFPSGSKWGIPQLESLAFPLEPQVHDFSDLLCGCGISSESLKVLDRLKVGFGIEETEWGGDNLPVEYQQFYDDLADMLPQIKAREHTPRKPATRSNTTLPSSSAPPSSSPWSVGNTKRSAPVSTRSTPSKTSFPAGLPCSPGKYEDDLDISPTPTPKRPRQSSTISPRLPARLTTPMKLKQVTTPASHDREFTSSQTDSTFKASETDNSGSESERSAGDRPEINVASVIRSLLVRICREHKDSNGYKFTAGYDADTLTVPICGNFSKTTPDLIVRLEMAGKKFHILDFESKRLKMQMTKVERFAQEVAHLLGRANAMKSGIVSDYYDVFLLTAHNMEFSILTCRVSNKYLHRLQTRLPRSGDALVVHRYGPVDIFNTTQRVEAVCTIYKLMLDRATTHLQGEQGVK